MVLLLTGLVLLAGSPWACALAGRIRLQADGRGQDLDARLAYQRYTLQLSATRARSGWRSPVRGSPAGGGVLDLACSLGLAAPHAFTVWRST